MKVRRFNEVGLNEFESYLRRLKESPTEAPPLPLLQDVRATEEVTPAVEVERRTFRSKYEAGRYLTEALRALSVDQLRQDVGLWGWLTLFYFDDVCPPDGRGHRKPKDFSKYLSRSLGGADGLVKHLLFFPWRLVQQHGEAADFILAGDLPVDAKITREWGTRLYEALLGPKVRLGRELYWDGRHERIRRGATSTGGAGQPGRRGNVRRFLAVLNQLELTYDLSAMSTDELAGLLPEHEFHTWLHHRSAN